MAQYQSEVLAAFSKKVGSKTATEILQSKEAVDMLERMRRASVHPVAAAGFLQVKSGLAPDRAPPSGLCCGQRKPRSRRA